MPPSILPEANYDHAVSEYVKAKTALHELELEAHQWKVEARSEVEAQGYTKSDAKDLLLLSPKYKARKAELAAQELIVYRLEAEVNVMWVRLQRSIYEAKSKRERSTPEVEAF